MYNGIVTDRYLETNRPGVYAAADVASSFHPTYGQRFRLEHWSAAGGQGRTAAWNMLGQRRAYDKVPYLFSDQYDFSMEYRGRTSGGEELVVRPGGAEDRFIAFWIRDSRVAAAMNANIWDQSEALERLVASRAVVDRARLVDPDLDLASLVEPRALARLGLEARRG